ncbi:MAG: hypothetical protein LBT02_00840 [Rickettsiales bacterium]|jgi:DNA-binding cell septation regulator SpoVG|nr:hypothetical protein [Rickettsiales bacterium]
MKIIDNLNEFIEKVDNMKKVNPLDLSSDQDLSIAIMNLISIEEHLFFSGAKTQDNSFYELINPIREDRKELLKKIIKTYKGEVWCISKHLLAGCMRLMEVGTKALGAGKKEEAYNFFEKAYSLYTLFWGLNLNSIGEKEVKDNVKKLDKETADKIEKDVEKVETKADIKEHTGTFGKLKNFVSKAIDCCIE